MILTRKGGGNYELRAGAAFALTDMVQWGYQGLRNIRPQVGEREARGIPALHRAARLRAEAVATFPLYCWRGEGPTKERIDTVWQARLFRNGPQTNQTNPVQTRFSFWETVEESLSWRNNSYIWKNIDPASGRITDWWALHPDQVTPHYDQRTLRVMYEVKTAPGYVDPVGRGPATYEKDSGTILHVRGHGQGGALFAPSPMQVFRDALMGPIGRQRHEARMWRRGTALQVAIEFPAGVSEQQAEQWREKWRANYEGTEGETTAVLGGGGVIKPIGMSLADAQFAEMADLTVQDASRIMAVPANLLGSQVVKVRTNLEDDLAAWLRFGLSPELARIEEALYADPDLFGGAQTHPEFQTAGFVRGDIQTEAAILQGFVQAGILTPNEARHELGKDADTDPNSDTLQTTPVGGAENPGLTLKPLNATPVETGAEEPRQLAGFSRDEMELVLRDVVRDEMREERIMRETPPPQPVTVNVEPAQPDLEPLVDAVREQSEKAEERSADLVRQMGEMITGQPPPIVNVHVPEHQPPDIHVHVPEQEPPTVNVSMPEMPPMEPPVVNVDVHVPENDQARKRVSVERNRQGFITGMTVDEED